jgi:hypothetical protein
MDPAATARAKKWDKAEHAKFRMLVKKGLIDPEQNDGAYLEKIREKHWGDWTAKIGRPPLLNFVLQSLKMASEQGVQPKTKTMKTKSETKRVRAGAVWYLLFAC